MAVEGRRTVVAWVSAAFTSQSLLQDLTLGPDNQLRQAFVPELQMLRNGAPKPVVRVRYLHLALFFLNHAYTMHSAHSTPLFCLLSLGLFAHLNLLAFVDDLTDRHGDARLNNSK